MRAFSVGFVPIESEIFTNTVNGRTVTGTRYLKQELYEISCVTLPANPQALVGLSLDGLQKSGLSIKDLYPHPPSQGPSPLPAAGDATPPAASTALVGMALDCLVKRRLRYHLGL
jgi:hypothetical protein